MSLSLFKGSGIFPFDLQINGYFGSDFNDLGITLEGLRKACLELEADGVGGILATIITDDITSMCAKMEHLSQLREQDELIRSMINGFHIEGPFINPEEGYVGAHPAEATREASVDDCKHLLEAGRGLVKLFTLAPECDPGLRSTCFLVEQGVQVSGGHSNASLDQLRAGIDNGMSMFTHLGNGCPVSIDRHDNIIQRVLSLSGQLWVCYIPDGVHIQFFALKNYLKVSGVDKSIMVTDAIASTKLGSGRYFLSGMEVEVDERGVARKPNSRNLAGSTLTMPQIVENVTTQLGLGQEDIKKLVDANPRKALDGLIQKN